MIEVKNLTKAYGSKKAVDNISFTVNDGEILGFLGPNGAGKSTTMNIITGYSSATQGTVTVNGSEIFEKPLAVKAQIGYLPEHPPLYLDMTVQEYLFFMFDLKKLRLPREQHVNDICEQVKITDVKKRIIKNLSKGYRQRVGLAQALLGMPSVLILDEPTVGLDPHQIIEMRDLIKAFGKDHTIILSSHILSEVQATCDRVIVINNGTIIADDTTDNLSKSMSADHKLTVRVDGPENDVYEALKSLPAILQIDRIGVREPNTCDFLVEAQMDTDIRRDLFRFMAERQWPILEMKSGGLTLEEIFLKLTTGESVPQSAIGSANPESSPEASDNTDQNDNDENGGDQ